MRIIVTIADKGLNSVCNSHPKVAYCVNCGKELKRRDAKRCTRCCNTEFLKR